MVEKTVKFNQKAVSGLPNNKPVVYRILTEHGKDNYVGVAQRGRVQERLNEHLDQGKIPGAKVRIEQKPTLRDAKKSETRIIARSQPKYNKKGK